MKRIICMVVCVIMLVSSALTGCGNTSKTSEETSSVVDSAKTSTSEETTSNEATGKKEFKNKHLDVYMFEGGYGSKYMNAISDRFKEDYPGVDITITASPTIFEIVKQIGRASCRERV